MTKYEHYMSELEHARNQASHLEAQACRLYQACTRAQDRDISTIWAQKGYVMLSMGTKVYQVALALRDKIDGMTVKEAAELWT